MLDFLPAQRVLLRTTLHYTGPLPVLCLLSVLRDHEQAVITGHEYKMAGFAPLPSPISSQRHEGLEF